MYRVQKWCYARTYMSGHGHAPKEYKAKKQDIILMGTTFLVGVFVGGYMYVIGFAPQFQEFTGQTEDIYEGFVVEGEQYGGFRAGTPPSFQVLQDGSFRYIGYTPSGQMAEPKEGTVPRAIWSEVKNTLDEDALIDSSEDVASESCISYVDGIDYNYKVTLQSQIFELDTCTTALNNTKVKTSLDKLWNYFETLQ